ncbi:MAG: tyrosine-type recombinase/integrase [Hyphomicrobiales bacterium]|nr:tyrosine-type recombinase/integrase [Hyphomicrobiales bacterium]MCP5001134.1 tyrosine-type recombinase/integrase [Hyphomicrobiales bacterium]
MRQPIRQATKTDTPKMTSQETARRELTVLRAALNAWHAETPLDALPVVTLPRQSPPRNRWLTRAEVARLLRATRQLEDVDAGRALRRFIIISIYTATRSGAVRRLGWLSNTLGGHVDLNAGVMHRRGIYDDETRKRRPPVRIPGRIAGSLRRWRAEDMRKSAVRDPIPFVIHFRGRPVTSQRRSWTAACNLAGLATDVTPHILKHTAITWMMQSGIDPWDVSAYAGTSLKMIEQVYGHHHPEFQSGAAERIGKRK